MYRRGGGIEGGKDVLGQVVAYLEEARMWADVSAFVKRKRFVVDGEWRWDWGRDWTTGMVGRRIQDDWDDVDDGDDEDGGVRLSS